MIGETLGSFRIVSKLGAGGMGVIYQAEHQMIGKRAAIKVLRPEMSRDHDVVGRFFNEAKAVTAIDHPGLVDVYDFGYTTDGSAYIVMELLAGESLATRLRRDRALPIDVALAWIRQLCGALGAAHAHHIVHRDLKPDNIYLTPDPDVAYGVRAKVLDFGIAKLAPGLGGLGTPETQTGMLLGTPLYMAPEQCRGAAEVDHRADIYALGVIMFEMICGQVPFTGIGIGEVIGKHQYESPPSPRAFAPTLPPPIEALILRMLAKPPDQRPQSMPEIVAALDGRTSAPQTVATLAPAAHDPTLPATALAAGSAPGASAPPIASRAAAAAIGPATIPSRRGLYAGVALAAVGAVAIVVVALGLRGGATAHPRSALELLPSETAFVLGIEVEKLEQTSLWRDERSAILAAVTRGDDEHVLDKLRTRCDLDPMRDLHRVTYAFGTASAVPGEGAFLVEGAWDRDKLDRCVTQLAPELLSRAQPTELADGPIRQYGDIYIAWVAPHIAAIALARNGIPYLRLITRHAAPAADRAVLQQAVARIDRDALVWFAGAVPAGFPAGMDPLDVLEHGTMTSLSVTLDAELDAHFTVTSTPARTVDLEQKLDAQLARARVQVPLASEIRVAGRGDTLNVDVHLDAAKLATLGTVIDTKLRAAPEPPPPTTP